MTTAQEHFEAWLDDTYHDTLPNVYKDYHRNFALMAWQHQQKRIDELEEQLKDRQQDLDFEFNRAEGNECEANVLKDTVDELEKKLNIACDDINRLHHRLMVGDRNYQLSVDYSKHMEALKQIEVSE